MVQESLPIATVLNDGWAIFGSTPHELMDDPVGSPDDGTTRITSVTVDERVRVNVASMTDPVISTGHILHFRAKSSVDAGDPETMRVRLFQGATQKAESGIITITRLSWNDYSYTLDATETDSITDYSDLRIELVVVALEGGDRLEVTQCYFECPDVSVGGDEPEYLGVIA